MNRFFRRFAAAICTLALCTTPSGALSVEQAIGLLEENYVDELPAAAYEAATLDELFGAIGDPYTYYMDAADYKAFTAGIEDESSVTGIGAGIEYTANGILITSLLDGGGAKDSGMQVGDCVIAIDGVSCVPATEAHRSLIVGEAGTYVTLTVRRPDGTVAEHRIERRSVVLHNTNVTLADGVCTIDCGSFGSQTATYVYDGVTEHEGDARLWVVDLRNNLGGYTDAAVDSLGVFTGFGPKLYYRMADGSSYYTLYFDDKETEKPVIVLANQYTASASEIFSGGIRAENAGILVGPRTYGKGTAQILLDETSHPDLFDGDCVKITVCRFYCSDGNTTDKIGVLPTLFVSERYAEDVAALLCAVKPDSDDYLRLMLNGRDYYVDLAVAQTERYADAFSELLGALPPDAGVAFMVDDIELPLDVSTAVRLKGLRANSRRFTDLAGSSYAMQINTLHTYGILNGDGAGHFFPKRPLTRAELAAMLTQTLNVTSAASAGYSDVSDTMWFADAVNAAVGLGFIAGGGERFDPSGSLTREEFIEVMGRLARFLNFHADDYALALTEEELGSDPSLAPFRPSSRAAVRVLTGYAGNMLDTELSEINPKAAVTREQAAATLCNMLKLLNILSY